MLPNKFRNYRVALILVLCMAVAFVLRAIPVFFIHGSGFLAVFDTDTWYTLRQVELMVSHYPEYAWFDPMTAYPAGKIIDWGPFFPFVAASLCLLLGATTHSAVIGTSGWISPIIATIMVPVMYLLGKTIWDSRTGLVAAGLISVVSFRFFFLSLYGYVDHHVMEVFFATLFLVTCLFFIHRTKTTPPEIKAFLAVRTPFALALLAGIFFFCGLITSTTVLLALPVIVIYTLIKVILDYFSNTESHAILFLNAISLSLAALLLVLFGVNWSSFSFTSYSLGLVVIILSVVAGTILLWVLAGVFRGRTLSFGTALLVFAIAVIGLLYSYPPFRSTGLAAQQLLFGSSAFSTVVQETLPWSLSTAWANFNIAIILMTTGLFVLGYYVVKKRQPEHLFFLLWSLVMLFVTIRYRRFEYYSTINIVVLTAICITEPFRWAGDEFNRHIRSFASLLHPETGTVNERKADPSKQSQGAGTPVTRRKKNKRLPVAGRGSHALMKQAACILVIILAVLMVTISALQDYDYAESAPSRQISPDWIESLTWMQQNTPAPGIDYYRKYSPGSFMYPKDSYGVMASWEAGHWITFFAHRIPITNPFQDNLAGNSGAAAYFLSGNETAANTILRSYGGNYVITDSGTAIDTFSSLLPWQNNSVDVTPYIKWFLAPSESNPSVLQRKNEYDDAYFQTMIVRLQNFDGSLVVPGTVNYIQYTVRQVPSLGETSEVSGKAPVITLEVPLNASVAAEQVQAFNRNAASNIRAIALSDMPDKPLQPVPALLHYRLVHESPDDATVIPFSESEPVTLPGEKMVKVFEYVPGALIPGDGIVEVPIKTNTGRTFVYRQASANGTFTVPYPTSGSLSGVTATGPYHILGTNRYINVTENDVVQGNRVSA